MALDSFEDRFSPSAVLLTVSLAACASTPPSEEEVCLQEAVQSLGVAEVWGEIVGSQEDDCVAVELDGDTPELVDIQCVFQIGEEFWYAEPFDLYLNGPPEIHYVCGVGDVGTQMPCVHCVVMSGESCWSGVDISGQADACDWDQFEDSDD